MCSSSGRAIATSTHLVDPAAVGAELADPAVPGRDQSIRSCEPVGIRAERFRQRLDLLGCPGAHRLHRLGAAARRRSRRAGCRAPRRWSGRARDGGRSRLGRRRSRRAGHRVASAARSRSLGRLIEGTARSAPAPRRPVSRESRDPRAACRASRLRGRARSSRWPAAVAPARSSSHRRRRCTRAGRLTPETSDSRPAGSRWKPVIGAPESVVGMAATSAPRDRRDRLRRVDHAAAAEGDQPVGCGPRRRATRMPRRPASSGTRWTRSAASPGSAASSRRPIGGEQLEVLPPLPRQRLERIGDRPAVEEQRSEVVGVLDPLPGVRRLQLAQGQEPGVGLEPTAS